MYDDQWEKKSDNFFQCNWAREYLSLKYFCKTLTIFLFLKIDGHVKDETSVSQISDWLNKIWTRPTRFCEIFYYQKYFKFAEKLQMKKVYYSLSYNYIFVYFNAY